MTIEAKYDVGDPAIAYVDTFFHASRITDVIIRSTSEGVLIRYSMLHTEVIPQKNGGEITSKRQSSCTEDELNARWQFYKKCISQTDEKSELDNRKREALYMMHTITDKQKEAQNG